MEWERSLKIAVGRMEPEDRNAFMELANSYKDDGSVPILGIMCTNGFRVSNIFDGPEMHADGHNAYSSVIKIGSHINHMYVHLACSCFGFQSIFIRHAFLLLHA